MTDHGQHSDNRKNSGGKTYKQMVAAMQQYVYEVCKCCSQQHGKQAQAVTGEPAEEVEKKTSKEAVS